MPFFIKKKGGKPQKSGGAKKWKKDDPKAGKKPFTRKRRLNDDEISSDSDDDEVIEPGKYQPEAESSSESEEETPQDKRLRLAKQYLSEIQDEYDADENAVGDRLKQDILESSGRLQNLVADRYLQPEAEKIRVCRGHKLPITCVVVTADDKFIFSGSKDCSIFKWDAETGRKVKEIPGGRKGTTHTGHTATVLCLALTTDNQFLASGDKNKLILIWRPDTCEFLHKLTGHRDAVSGLAFRRGTHQLFSASFDRTVKIWNVDAMAYAETLFGHHDVITAIDSLTRERAVTSGGRDGSVRIWKVIEESQLVFNGHTGSIDCVSLMNEEHFVSGADDNSLAVWSVLKKKPIAFVRKAHGIDKENPGENWITSVATLTQTDLVASGSKDGFIRLWKCGQNFRQLTQVLAIPVVGFVNSLKFSHKGDFLVAGVGQEHRLGRWWRLKEARNSVCIIPLEKRTLEEGESLKAALPSMRKRPAKRGKPFRKR